MNPETPVAPAMRRRVQVRYICDLFTRCAEADSPPAKALVVDISRTGISLLLDQPFERGSIVAVEMPPTGAVHACVLHSSPLSGGWRKVGCRFTETLSEESLNSLWKPSPDRRSVDRLPADIRATYESDKGRGIATVTDISKRGLCLLVERDLPEGLTLRLQLRGDCLMDMTACVVRVCEQEEGIRACGCSFTRELTDAEMSQFA